MTGDFGICAGEGDADKASGFDDAGDDVDEPEAQGRKLGIF